MVAKALQNDYFDFKTIKASLIGSILKFSFFQQIRNPVMFCAYVSALITTGLYIASFYIPVDDGRDFILSITITLWLTLLFGNFAEAIAEERGKAQAQNMRRMQSD